MDFEKDAEEKKTEQLQLFKSSVVNCRTEQVEGIALNSYLLRGNIPLHHLPEILTPPPETFHREITS